MRVEAVAFVAVLTLGFAAPTQAAPFTIEFHGLVMGIGGAVGEHVVPELEAGDPFNALITFGEGNGHWGEISFNLGVYAGSAVCLGCSGPAPIHKPAISFMPMPGSAMGPPTRWSPGGHVQHSLFTLSLAEGWKSGSFFIWMENVYIGGGVTGSITRVKAGPQPVPEPATILLTLIGVGLGARRLRRRHDFTTRRVIP